MAAEGMTTPQPAGALPSFAEALRVWARIGCLSFGGPAAQIALMHREVVDEKRWVGEQKFLHALNFCMLLPGPEAMQLMTYLGWLMRRTWVSSTLTRPTVRKAPPITPVSTTAVRSPMSCWREASISIEASPSTSERAGTSSS